MDGDKKGRKRGKKQNHPTRDERKESGSLSSMDSMESASVVAECFADEGSSKSMPSSSTSHDKSPISSSRKISNTGKGRRNVQRDCPHCTKSFTSYHAVATHLTVGSF